MALPERLQTVAAKPRAACGCAAALLLLFATIMHSNLDGWDLWNPDEPRYAQVAREMLETGQYLLPHLNGQVYADKPPLFFWLVAAASLPWGDVVPLAARLPSVIAALGLLVLTFFLGTKLFDGLTGLIAMVVLFTAVQAIYLATRANIDMTLALLTTSALYFFFNAYAAPGGRLGCSLLSYAAMGLAVLAKGPVGLIVPLLTIVLFLAAKGELAVLRRIHLGKGTLLLLAVVAAWYVPACLIAGPGYLQETLGRQVVGRVVDSYSHRNPLYYYLLVFPGDFFPWSLFIPSACVYLWRSRSAQTGLALPLAWFVGTFIFFSCISGKRSLYLMPLYPAAALLVAKFWRDHLRMEGSGAACLRLKLFSMPAYLLCGILGMAGAAVLSVLLLGLELPWPIIDMQPALYPLAIVLVIGGSIGAALIRRTGRLMHLFATLALVMISAYIVTAAAVFPAVNAFKSARPFCERIKKIVGPDDTLIASFEPDMFNYFLRRYPIPRIEDPAGMLPELSSPARIYLLVKEQHWQQAPAAYRKLLILVDQQSIGHATYCLLSNRPV